MGSDESIGGRKIRSAGRTVLSVAPISKKDRNSNDCGLRLSHGFCDRNSMSSVIVHYGR